MVGWRGAESRNSADERAAYIGEGSKLAIGMLLWEKELEMHTQGRPGRQSNAGLYPAEDRGHIASFTSKVGAWGAVLCVLLSRTCERQAYDETSNIS